MPDLSDYWPFVAAFAVLVGGGVGLPPIPEELPVAGAGIWVANSTDLSPLRWLILPVCIAGILLSDLILYGLGRWWGTRLLSWGFIARLLTPEKRAQIEGNFHRYGLRILLLVRWLPGIRSPMFITAGLMRLPVARFVVADAIAASVGHTVIFFLAYWFGDQFKDLLQRAEDQVGSRVKPIAILAGILAVVGYLLLHLLRRPVTTADPKELPIIGGQVAATIEHRGAGSRVVPPPPDGQAKEPCRDEAATVREQGAERRP